MHERYAMAGRGVLEVFTAKLTITPKGALGFRLKRVKGTKEIPFASIVAIQPQKARKAGPSWTPSLVVEESSAHKTLPYRGCSACIGRKPKTMFPNGNTSVRNP